VIGNGGLALSFDPEFRAPKVSGRKLVPPGHLKLEDMMGQNAALQETFFYTPVASEINDGGQTSSWPSPDEGRRLIRDFVRIERADLRREIFRFVAEMLRVQLASQRDSQRQVP
jgi:hypothetical protein